MVLPGPGRTVKLHFSVPVGMYTVFLYTILLEPKMLVKTLVKNLAKNLLKNLVKNLINLFAKHVCNLLDNLWATTVDGN